VSGPFPPAPFPLFSSFFPLFCPVLRELAQARKSFKSLKCLPSLFLLRTLFFFFSPPAFLEKAFMMHEIFATCVDSSHHPFLSPFFFSPLRGSFFSFLSPCSREKGEKPTYDSPPPPPSPPFPLRGQGRVFFFFFFSSLAFPLTGSHPAKSVRRWTAIELTR